MNPYFLLFLYFPFSAFAQTDTFTIETIETDDPWNKVKFYDLEHYTPYFFEDENYIVTTKCNGEFGGEVYFEDKMDKTVTIAYSTCPVIINKHESKYYLTTSLWHLGGFYSINEISDPKELSIKSNDSIYQGRGDLMSGMKVLTGGTGKTILLSFKYNDNIYHIVCDHDASENYIAIRERATLKKIQLLNKLPMMTLSNNVCVTKDSHYAAKFYIQEGNWLRTCYFDIYENNIKIFLCKRE